MSIKQILITLLVTLSLHARHTPNAHLPSLCIMLDPAGDAKQAGRSIDDTFERALTMEFAQSLQASIEQALPNCLVIITRNPGETVAPLQNATFANRLPVNLYIHISFFQSTTKKSINLYQFSYGEPFITNYSDLSLIPFNKAHHVSYDITQQYAQSFERALTEHQKTISFTLYPLIAFPFTPLTGIKKPAIGIEMGLIKKEDWSSFVTLISQATIEALQDIA